MSAIISCREFRQDGKGRFTEPCLHVAVGANLAEAEGDLFEHLVRSHHLHREDAGLTASDWAAQQVQRRFPAVALTQALAQVGTDIDAADAERVLNFMRAMGLTVAVAPHAMSATKRGL